MENVERKDESIICTSEYWNTAGSRIVSTMAARSANDNAVMRVMEYSLSDLATGTPLMRYTTISHNNRATGSSAVMTMSGKTQSD